MSNKDQNQKVDGDTITNKSKNPHSIGGTVVQPGDTYRLTEENKKNELLMAKVNHAIKLKLLKRGAD